MAGLRCRCTCSLRRPISPVADDATSREFIRMLAQDQRLLLQLRQLLELFTSRPPAVYGTYQHHVSGR
jgi:hypothetical protein